LFTVAGVAGVRLIAAVFTGADITDAKGANIAGGASTATATGASFAAFGDLDMN
jgi:hypothetical protein